MTSKTVTRKHAVNQIDSSHSASRGDAHLVGVGERVFSEGIGNRDMTRMFTWQLTKASP